MQELPVTEIAARLGCSWTGDPEAAVRGVAVLAEAGEHDLSLYTDRRHRDAALATKAAAILVGPGESPLPPHRVLVVSDPHDALRRVLGWFYPPADLIPGVHPKAEVHPTAAIHPTARVDALATVGAGAVVGSRTHVASGAHVGDRVRLGADGRIGPNAVILDGATLGDRVSIGAGTVVGGVGFGFVHAEAGHRRIPHVGTLIIEDDVEIGANCTVDRGTLGATRIGRGTKIDNLVHIAHNVVIGEDVLIAAQCGISGSTALGNGVAMGGQAGISDHLVVAAGTRIAAKAGVMKSIGVRGGRGRADDCSSERTARERNAEGMTFAGHPARPLVEQRRAEAELRRLDHLRRRVRDLERRLSSVAKGDARR